MGTRRRGVVAALLAGASLTASGCGGDDGDAGPADSAAATAENATSLPGSLPAASPGSGPDAGAATTASGPTTSVGPATTAAPTTTTTPVAPLPPAATIESAALEVRHLFDVPLLTALASRPADGSIYVTSQGGQVSRVANGAAPEQVLDLSSLVTAYQPGSERGMLGIAFNPVDGRMFLYYTDDDPDPDSHVVSYALDAAGRPDPASVREVLAIDQPGLGHKGGGLAFTPDGTLFIASGDGGGSNGADAQDYSKLLGGIIRIVPNADGPGYTVPPDNPFVGQEGRAPEMWAKGLRNPWGFCRDNATGDLWWGDVGNNTMEEVDHLPAGTSGTNYGWPAVEGTQVNHPDAVPPDAVAPVFAYNHSDIGPAVIGGCVYRGAASPALVGAYVFADMTGQLFAIGADYQMVRLGIASPAPVTGWGIAPDGELIILTMNDGAFHLAPATPAA
ncbi:PQQ-dependent sugar dehydrogenase [Desertimonas flava]|uniref:PQQ-dependent sugar dehydrogenase n=1 Tax=Desertimonas flava TaxID=2064846 RepID=UPI0013C43036|nr:PQQ-dependent sugar dehydrogenase [Desertimonas flava]